MKNKLIFLTDMLSLYNESTTTVLPDTTHVPIAHISCYTNNKLIT